MQDRMMERPMGVEPVEGGPDLYEDDDSRVQVMEGIAQGHFDAQVLATQLGLSDRILRMSVDDLLRRRLLVPLNWEGRAPGQAPYALTWAGTRWYFARRGRSPLTSHLAELLGRPAAQAYSLQEAYLIDLLRSRCVSARLQALPERRVPLRPTRLWVQPDLTLYWADGRQLPVQIELGEKRHVDQRRQVKAGLFKALTRWERVDLWVDSQRLARRAKRWLKAESRPQNYTGGLPLLPGAEVRIYATGLESQSWDFRHWPQRDQPHLRWRLP